MKFILAIVSFAAFSTKVDAFAQLQRPIEDSFVWINEKDNGGTLRKVEIKKVDKYNSPGKFNPHRWDLI